LRKILPADRLDLDQREVLFDVFDVAHTDERSRDPRRRANELNCGLCVSIKRTKWTANLLGQTFCQTRLQHRRTRDRRYTQRFRFSSNRDRFRHGKIKRQLNETNSMAVAARFTREFYHAMK